MIYTEEDYLVAKLASKLPLYYGRKIDGSVGILPVSLELYLLIMNDLIKTIHI